jgi:hypothetical protein
MSDNTIKIQVGDTVKSRRNWQDGVVLSLFKSMKGVPLVAIDYGRDWKEVGVLVELEKDVSISFYDSIHVLSVEGLSLEQAKFFAPSYHQSLDKEDALIKIKQYLSLA